MWRIAKHIILSPSPSLKNSPKNSLPYSSCTAGFTSFEGAAACNITIVAISKLTICQQRCMACVDLQTTALTAVVAARVAVRLTRDLQAS
jgi:hypothetical protein